MFFVFIDKDGTLAHAYTVITSHVHAQDDDFASSSLGVACENNQLQVVQVLIKNGAMVNYHNKVCLHSILARATYCYCTCMS